ncbi:heavy metal translocating P-type ATPase [Tetragenococcus halophilus]|uniref:Cd(2+)-exporting ATPase n=2 Tax=Tetragenococcus halophilus TaxID=51669 RepID=A0A2H6CVC0_TETHA|nr:heavy metal translocating P-type ATPase [Tetragenococcus halophilus]AOF48442.1 HAD family hydrolase [Tetragenococcus halophilus]AYW49900.1 cadmium-translocating P-type ATPase [Tetragenococcus halophilus]MCF1602786.1 cadmium-translocating P-type ATPase [Tetragenococcus halophilus]MCO7027029.1 cadmium-translocating P-type ATPase [Tetragenococcus halophilus]MCO8285245.1 cadmium-translocating P-type ATPase [Tetragenococcus halophilus]
MKLQQWIMQHKNHLTLINGLLILLAGVSKFLFTWIFGYQLAMLIASVIGMLPIFLQAYQALRVKVISIDLLVSVAILGALLIGEYNESAIVAFLFLFGSFLEQKTLEKTRTAIHSLTQMAPKSALKITDNGRTESVDIDDIDKGDHLLVKTDAQVPVDGVIDEGEGYLNEASVTGESQQRKKEKGDDVFAGTFLDNGTLKIVTKRVGEDTTFGKIIELVEEAQDSKSNAERFIDKFAKYYTPAVLLLAFIVGIFSQDVRLAITILVLGCPGALVIGVPVSNVAGIGSGAKSGILIKGGEVIDKFSKVDTFVFDKTGTLTMGKPSVAAVKNYTDNFTESLKITASIERESDHPLGQAIVDYANVSSYVSVEQTNVVKGQGIIATLSDKKVLIGNQSLMVDHHVPLSKSIKKDIHQLQSTGHSLVMVAMNGRLSLLIGIKDQIRPGAKETLAHLKQTGVKELIMLTGDNQETAENIAQELGITKVYGNLLPENKADYIRQLQKEGHQVAFVGDGVNDSPSLALSDVGIAMGGGTEVAIETSDVVLIQSNFERIAKAYHLTKKIALNMQENIMIALATVLLLLIGLIFGYIYMASGMFVHELSILIVIFNGMRLLLGTKKKA